MLLALRFALVVATLVVAVAPLRAQETLYNRLNEIERDHLSGVLKDRALQLDHQAEGKVFGRLIIANLDVFQDDTAWLTWANAFHVTTRDWVIRDEQLWEEGEVFERELVQETVRNLRTSINISVVAMVPVVSDEPGVVDILAVTRDTWSLRLNFNLDFAAGVVNSLLIAVTERNLLGTHNELAAIFFWEQDTVSIGPRFIAPRLFRTRLALREELLFAINHDTGELEGTTNAFSFGVPLFSLSTDWGFNVSESHAILIDRLFVGSQVRTWDDPDTVEEEAVPYVVDTKVINVQAVARRGWGVTPRHILSFGYGLSINAFALQKDIAAQFDPAVVDAFERANLPRDDTASFGLLSYRFFSGRFRSVRNYQTYGFAEDLAVGHDLGSQVRLGPRFLGSDGNFFQWSASAGYTWLVAMGDDIESRLDSAVFESFAEAGARLDIDRGDWIDLFLSGRLRASSPQWGPFRLHAGGRIFVKRSRETTGLIELGASNGLRGYPTGAFLGESFVLGNFEVRTLSFELLSMKLGGVVFYDVGTVWDEGDDSLPLLSDVGVGLRLLIPQSQRFVFRFDYAFPLSGPSSALPGTFSIGTGQIF